MIGDRNKQSEPTGTPAAGVGVSGRGGRTRTQRQKYPTRFVSYSATLGQSHASTAANAPTVDTTSAPIATPSQASDQPSSGAAAPVISDAQRQALAAIADYAVWSTLAALPAIEDLDLSENLLTSVPEAPIIAPFGGSGRAHDTTEDVTNSRPWSKLKFLNLAMNKFDDSLKLIPLVRCSTLPRPLLPYSTDYPLHFNVLSL
jgi:hypothetical protein